MLAEPPVSVVLHLNIFEHDVGPLLQVLHLVVIDLCSSIMRSIVHRQATALLILAKAFLGVAVLLICDQIDDIEHLMLNIVLFDEGEDLLLDGRVVGDLVY